MSTYTLEERDGALYAKQTIIDEWLPRQIENWYQLATPYQDFILWFACEDAARQFLGETLTPTVNPPLVFENKYNWRFLRADARSTPVYQEFTPIPEPPHKGRTKLAWHKGAWHAQTAKGLVKIA